MKLVKSLSFWLMAVLLMITGTVSVQAETNSQKLRNMQEQIQQSDQMVKQKEKEKQSVNAEVKKIQEELNSIHTVIAQNKEELKEIEDKIAKTNQLIEEKKEAIVILEDKVESRKNLMKDRLVALQQNDKTSVILDTIFNSENLADLIDRVSAVSTLLNADNEILSAQQDDLLQIEEEKREIDKQEKKLIKEQGKLSDKQAELAGNLKKREQALSVMQERYKKIAGQIALAEQDRKNIESQMNDIQEKIKKEQAEARARAAREAAERAAREAAKKEEQIAQKAKEEVSAGKPVKEGSLKGKEMYVTATAYSYYENTSHGYITAGGYNIKENPNMKLIAVDPSIIPLGTRVWVEGYGVAVAGDTGGAIKGHKIDILMPSVEACYKWGRKTVKIVILD